MKPDPKVQRHVQRLRDNLPYDLDVVPPPPPAATEPTATEPTGTDPASQPPPAGEHDDGDETPAQRLQRAGATALADAEILGLLLDPHHPRATQRAARLIEQAGGFANLATTPDHEIPLTAEPESVVSLRALLELSRRLARARLPNGACIDQPELAAEYLFLRYYRRDQEIVGALYLDPRNRILAEDVLFRGTIYRTVLEPGTILRRALLHSAPAFLIFHQHTSGDPTPSPEDLNFTRRLHKVSKHLGIRFVDHIILGDGERWISLQRRGLW